MDVFPDMYRGGKAVSLGWTSEGTPDASKKDHKSGSLYHFSVASK